MTITSYQMISNRCSILSSWLNIFHHEHYKLEKYLSETKRTACYSRDGVGSANLFISVKLITLQGIDRPQLRVLEAGTRTIARTQKEGNACRWPEFRASFTGGCYPNRIQQITYQLVPYCQLQFLRDFPI